MNYVNNLTFNDKLMKTEEKANLKSFSKPPAMQIRFWKKTWTFILGKIHVHAHSKLFMVHYLLHILYL